MERTSSRLARRANDLRIAASSDVCLTHIESTLLPVRLGRSKHQRKEGVAAMKHHGIQYLALDVHQATIVATVRDETGAVRLRATIPTEARAILGLVKGLGPHVH